ncbi:MAG: cyclic-di-AMP receptor [Oscillospiraceae bacterium]
MKLIMAIVSSDDSSKVINALTDSGFAVTKLSTTGGFLAAGNTTLLVGVEDLKVDEVLEIIKSKSKKRDKMVPASASYGAGVYTAFPIDIKVGGAIVFVLDVDRFEKI